MKNKKFYSYLFCPLIWLLGGSQSQAKIVSLCDLPLNDKLYYKKELEINANYQTSLHFQHLYDKQCENILYAIVADNHIDGKDKDLFIESRKRKNLMKGGDYYIEFTGIYKPTKDYKPNPSVFKLKYQGVFIIKTVNVYKKNEIR